jgi:hypothetical protein
MANLKQAVTGKVGVSAPFLGTLASGAYVTTGAKDNTTTQPSDLLVEVNITPGAVSGNKQAVLFALGSIDGLNYQTGANSADEAVMTRIGSLQLPSAGTPQTGLFTVAASFGGVLPPNVKFVVKNDSGAAFTAGAIYVSEVSLTVG